MEDNTDYNAQPLQPEQPELPKLKNTFKYFPFKEQKLPIFILIIIGILFNCTSLNNEYALDDGIVIHQNENVLKGVAGIKNILTKDVFESFYRRMCATDQLQGGRYRPLSVISFAIEQQVITPYRTGLYMKVEDSNKNGVLDNYPVSYTTSCGKSETNYEFNDFIDLNNDGIAQGNECYPSWDLNKNFVNDVGEDLNKDGVFNEVDSQVYGAKLRHFNNIWTYILACIFLYLVFRNYWFKDNHDLAFLSALIFLIHPIHSEVVAVVCRRDEIFSLLFIALTFLFSFRYMENKRTGTLFLAAIMFLMALLSKEYGIVLLALVPLAFYVFNKEKIEIRTLLPPTLILIAICAFIIILREQKIIASGPLLLIALFGLLIYILTAWIGFKNALNKKDVSTVMIWLYGAFIIYIGMRSNAVSIITGVPDTEILNNAYLLATGEERFCTKIFVMLKYLCIQIFPHPLISDYSFDAIAYRHFSDWDFILSLILHITLFALGIKLLIKRHAMGFVIICYLAFMLIIANVFFYSGINMNEHFIFHASIAFSIAISWLALKLIDKLSQTNLLTKRMALFAGLTVVIILFGCKTWERNWDWKNDVTLFLKDINNSPNSVLILGNAGARWVDLADTKEITGNYIDGTTEFNDYNGTLRITDQEVKLGGFKNKREAALYKGIGYLLHAVELHPRYVNGYLNLGLAYYKVGKDYEAILYWKMAERLYPNNPYLRNYYIVYYNQLKNRGAEFFNAGNFKEALVAYNLTTIVDPYNPDGWYNLGGTYFNMKQFKRANACWHKVLKLDPYNKEVYKLKGMWQGTLDSKK